MLRVVGCYTTRWWIEEYHKALKSGSGVETSQLARADRLQSLIAVLAVVAVRLLGVKLLARLSTTDADVLKTTNPPTTMKNLSVMTSLESLGCFRMILLLRGAKKRICTFPQIIFDKMLSP
jgi:hypothetical protein